MNLSGSSIGGIVSLTTDVFLPPSVTNVGLDKTPDALKLESVINDSFNRLYALSERHITHLEQIDIDNESSINPISPVDTAIRQIAAYRIYYNTLVNDRVRTLNNIKEISEVLTPEENDLEAGLIRDYDTRTQGAIEEAKKQIEEIFEYLETTKKSRDISL